MAQARADLGGGTLFAYDEAGRLARAAKSGAPLSAAADNSVLKPADLSQPDAFAYTYDAAQNLLAKTDAPSGVPVTTALPLDASGRNRPGSVNGVPLQWDKNGNLIQKGNLSFHYDFRNRLVQVTGASDNHAEIAHYDYDAFNRRITTTVGGDSRTTIWQGWRPIEEYAGATLKQRRTYGSGLDEIVYLESDLDGSGHVAAKSWPVYDASGNLVLLTNSSGKALERYAYTPYGAQTILVNSQPPAVQQVRVVGNAVWVELSEGVLGAPLAQALSAGTITLLDNTTHQAMAGLAITQPVLTGDLAGRRLVITTTSPAPTAQDQVILTIPATALVDAFQNRPAQPYSLTFAWPAADAVVADLAAPAIRRVSLLQGILEVELSVEPNLASATTAIHLDGAPVTWTLAADHYTLKSGAPVTAGSHTLTIAVTLTDLGGLALASAFSQSFVAAQQATQTIFAAPSPQETSASAVGNHYGFQGQRQDSETGLVYMRNRYYDPEMGHFISPDPLGYADGPSEHAFERNDPANGRDPLGLLRMSDIQGEPTAYQILELDLAPWEIQAIIASQSGFRLLDLRTNPDAAEINLRSAKEILLLRKRRFLEYVNLSYLWLRGLNAVHYSVEAGVALASGREPVMGTKVNRGDKAAELVVYMGIQWLLHQAIPREVVVPRRTAPPSETFFATRGMGGRILSRSEQAEFEAFANRARSAGLQESSYRTGSWGRLDRNGRYQEVARIDVGDPGEPGWRGRTHVHVSGQTGHLPTEVKIPGEQ